MSVYQIALSPGDTIGGELMVQVRKVLAALERKSDARFDLLEIVSCGPAIDRYGTALRPEDMDAAQNCRAVLFGNIGDKRYQSSQPDQVPTYALTAMRKAIGVCTNLRPACILPEFASLSPLRPELLRDGMDILVIRDLGGGMIVGRRETGVGPGGAEASDLEYYNEAIIRRSARFAFQAAQQRRGRVMSVDKANVLASAKLWRRTVTAMQAAEYPDVSLSHDYVDHAAMQLLLTPGDYDVLVTSNMFGDILSDEAAQISGAPWMFGSAELAEDGRGIYTPNQLHHPRSEALSGRGEVNPYGILNALAMLLRYSCQRPDLADAVEQAIRRAVSEHLFTPEALPEGAVPVSTDALGDAVASYISVN